MNKKYHPMYFHTVDETKLKFTKPCAYGHHGPDGQNVRLKETKGTTCLACKYHMPVGEFLYQFNKDLVEPAKPTLSPDEARKRHSQQVMEYHKRNPEKLKGWQRTWANKPETKEKERARHANLPRERKDELNERARKFYADHRDEIRAKHKEAYYAKKLLKLQEKQDGNQS